MVSHLRKFIAFLASLLLTLLFHQYQQQHYHHHRQRQPNTSIYAKSLWARKGKYYNEITLTYHNELPVVHRPSPPPVSPPSLTSWLVTGLLVVPLIFITIRVLLLMLPPPLPYWTNRPHQLTPTAARSRQVDVFSTRSLFV